MPYDYILKFTIELSKSFNKILKEEIEKDRNFPLNFEFLQEKANKELNPHSFGGGFVVAPVHTPFRKIFELAEKLLKEAKRRTERKVNSVNWRVLSTDEESIIENLIPFDKPLPIEKGSFQQWLSFEDYYDMVDEYKEFSSSHIHQIVEKAINITMEIDDKVERGKKLEKFLKGMPAASADKNSLHNKLILDERLKDEGFIDLSRLFTLFELIRLSKCRKEA